MGFDLFVIWVDLMLVTIACFLNFRAAKHGIPINRFVYAAIAALCLLHMGGYIWLLTDYSSHFLLWSRIFTGVDLVAWPLVWCYPAVRSVYANKLINKEIEKHVSNILHKKHHH